MTFIHWIILFAIGFGFYIYINSVDAAKPKVCKACGHSGRSSTKVRGNIGIEIVLWLCFIIPGLIYSLWRSGSRYKACAQCGSDQLIPADSPMGKKILADLGNKKS